MMKYLFLFCLIFTLSCKKDKELPLTIFDAGKMEYGFATFKKNNLSGKASALAATTYDVDSTFTVSFRTYVNESDRESWGVSNLPKKIGKYKVNFQKDPFSLTSINGNYFTLDWDISYNDYNIVESKDNYIEITSFEKNEAKGKFQFHFTIVKPEKINEPDNVSFTEGEFEVKLKK